MAEIVGKKSEEKMLCKLCLSTVKDDNFKLIDKTIVEVLNVLLLQLNVQENEESVICNTCLTKLFAAFQFKAKCMDTEDSIFPYVNSERMAPVSLMHIYLNINGHEPLTTALEDKQICRLCMQITTSGHIPLKEINDEMTCNYIPEVNFNSIKEPAICKDCLDSLDIHNRFLKSCLDIEKKTQNISENGTGINANDKSDEDRTKKEDTLVQYKEKCKYNSIIPRYKCPTCDYKTNHKARLQRHQLIHGDLDKRTIYKCESCDYKAIAKQCVQMHSLTHCDPSQIQKYKCDLCDYETIHEKYLKVHQKRHKVKSEVRMYKCDKCDHKTTTKGYLRRHQLVHKDLSEVRTYKCDICPFVTKHRSSYGSHLLTHKAPCEIQMYKCDQCDFETKQRPSFTSHKLRHKEISEAQMYDCDECEYSSPHKVYLARHKLNHKEELQIKRYECNLCDFRTKYKQSLIDHKSRHQDISQVQV